MIARTLDNRDLGEYLRIRRQRVIVVDFMVLGVQPGFQSFFERFELLRRVAHPQAVTLAQSGIGQRHDVRVATADAHHVHVTTGERDCFAETLVCDN